MTAYYHGGVAGLAIGDLLEPGHSRDHRHPDCPICRARAAGTTTVDLPSARPDRVYLTEDREYARYHAALYGRGDLYMVEPLGAVEVSEEDLFPTIVAPAARVLAVLQRGVLLSMSQRRKIYLRWSKLEGLTRRQALVDFHRMLEGLGL